MNSVAVKAFLRGAMQENPTDEQIEELITFLKGFVKASKATRQLLLDFKEAIEDEILLDYNTPDMLKQYFFDEDMHPDYYEQYGSDEVEIINWQWIYEELKK